MLTDVVLQLQIQPALSVPVVAPVIESTLDVSRGEIHILQKRLILASIVVHPEPYCERRIRGRASYQILKYFAYLIHAKLRALCAKHM